MQLEEETAARFEEHRARLHAVAYRMLGSLADAEDAVQNAWLRLDRAGSMDIDNLGGWLTTVVGRECLHLLRARRRRREDSLEPFAAHLPDPLITDQSEEPANRVERAESVSLALLVLLDSLGPAERVAFVLHDMFMIPFQEIAPLLEKSTAATRQQASRARRKIRDNRLPEPAGTLDEQRADVEAFYTAANEGDFTALLQVLAPDVAFHADQAPGLTRIYRGADTVARQSRAVKGAIPRPVMVNGQPGAVMMRDAEPVSLMSFTVANGRIVAIYGIRNRQRLRQLTAHPHNHL